MLTGAYTALPGPSPSLGAPGKQELGSRSRAGTRGRPRGRASVQGLSLNGSAGAAVWAGEGVSTHSWSCLVLGYYVLLRTGSHRGQ